MSNNELLPVSDMYRLAVLDVTLTPMVKAEYQGKRYRGYFDKATADRILAEYEAGMLKVSARDFVASLKRVKDRIFENERKVQENG